MKNAYYKKSLALTFSLISLAVTAGTTGQLTLTDSSGVVVPTYQNGESAYIQVVDSDGNADPAVAETLTVTITSETEDTGTPFSATTPVAGSSNVGDGTLTVLKTSYDTKTENWTLLAVSANSFLVTGSVSGQQSQQYAITDGASEKFTYTSDNNEVSFKIENGTVAYAVGDTFTFSTSAGTIVGETVTLTETGIDTGIFTNSITFNEAASPSAADGILDVQSGDLITVFYDDSTGDWGEAEQVRSTALYAATVIKGSTLLADTIWTEENSPYLITGDVTVSVNTTLTIMPGVKVLFLANTDDTVGGQAPYDSELIIQGTLNIAGTDAKGITLTSSNREPAIGDWGGVRVENGTASITYTTLEYSAYGVDLNNVSYGKTFSLSNSILSSNGIGVKVSSASSDGIFTITDNTISNTSGRVIDGNNSHAKWTLSGNIISNNGSNSDHTLYFDYSYSLSLTNNQILDNVGGIQISSVRDDLIFTGNTLSNNQDNDMMMSGGLSISSWHSEGEWMTDSIIIEDNIIDNNSQTGIYLSQSGNADPAINRNKVRNNSGYGIYVYSETHNTQPSIHDNEITGNGLSNMGNNAGLYISGKAVPSIVGNTIDNNGAGIYVNYDDVNGNGDFDLTDNTITNNQGYGLSVNGYAKPVINNNDIYENTGYALENHTSFAVDAKNNWWGVDDSAEISGGTNPQTLSFIYDGNTDSTAGKVNYAGWLNSSNQDGGTPVSDSITGQLTLTDSSGVVVPTYQSGESAYIQVVDSDGNADPAVAETLTVTITSETEDTGTPFSATTPVAGSSNVGDGTLTVLKTSYDTKTENWTLLAVSANSFLVTGSVSGQQSQQYAITDGASEKFTYTSDNNEVSFKIENGTVAYAVGDTFTFSTSAGTIVGETVTLTETGIDTGIFTNSITFNEAASPSAADGILDVQSGDLITVFYDDSTGDWGEAEQVRSTALYAATVIKGSTLLADTIWTEENSPYLITGDVTVSVNTTLTIMPGVKVLFLANTDDTVGGQAPYDSELIIQGTLNIAGTDAKGITLTSSNREPAIGDWGGVRVENGTASITYTTLEYSAYGVDLNNVSYGKTFSLSNSILSSNGIGVKVSSASSDGIFTITDNTISNTSGRVIDGNNSHAKWTLSGNIISNNGSNSDHTLYFDYSYSLSLTNNQILDNVGGIQISSVRDDLIFTGNTLSNNQDNDMMMSGGLSISSWHSEGEWMTDSIIIEDNIIDNNSQTGIYLSQSGNADPAINRNKVRNNSGYGIYVYSETHNTQPSIHDNEITGNGLSNMGNNAGLYISGKAVPSIVGNTIDNNGAGIYVNYDDVNGNGDFDLTDNTITNNQGYGLSVNGYAKPVINNNDIYENTGYALENHTSFAVDAKNNWWGVDDSAEISGGTNPQTLSFIYDGNTDSTAGKVNYAGWLNSSITGSSPFFDDINELTVEATGTLTALVLTPPKVNYDGSELILNSDYAEPLVLGSHEVTWTATDSVGRTSTAIQLVHIVDTTGAEFDDAQIQTIDAMGVLSDISDAINNVQAYDLVDGNINSVVIGDTIYPSGTHLVPVSATDSSGNIVEANVEVHINPLVELSQSRKVEPGATVLLPVTLSGNAAIYPVGITYTLMQSVSIIETSELLITEDISGVITIAIPNDALDGDIYSVAITSTSNAALGFVTSTQLTVDDANFGPTLTLVTQQDDKNISVVDTTNGVVTVTAIVNDINVNDTHDIVWSSLNDTLVDLNTDASASTFEFSAEGLATGTYELTMSVSESNTSELLSVSVDMDIVVDAALAALDANTDSDNDGISDADEGYGDSDNDGISDYLDTDDNPSRLPIDDSTASMQTVNGLSLSLGDVVTTSDGATAANATVDVNDITSDEHFTTLSSITNFNVSGLTEVGQSVPIVIPLASGNTIAEGSIYRKYSDTKGWFDFVVDSENGVYSALADEDGNCPYPLSTQYQEGLSVGDNCIQLVIKDGGENDADGLANGMVKDPGVLTSEVLNQAPVIVVNTNETSNEGSVVTFDASATTDAENDTLIYQWVQLTGATVELSGQNTATLSFTAPQVSNDEFLTFELTVNDGRDSTTTEVEVLVLQVNIAPTVSIDSHTSSFDEGATVSLTATGADEDDDALSYEWVQTSGPTVTLSGASSASVTFTAPAVSSDQNLEFKVTVSDGIDTESKTTTVTVKNTTTVTPTTPSKESGGGGGSMGWILIVMSFGLLRKRLIKVAA